MWHQWSLTNSLRVTWAHAQVRAAFLVTTTLFGQCCLKSGCCNAGLTWDKAKCPGTQIMWTLVGLHTLAQPVLLLCYRCRAGSLAWEEAGCQRGPPITARPHTPGQQVACT